jgi:calcineurin-like phosphoesterase
MSRDPSRERMVGDMNLWMVGDIVGPDAVAYLVERLPGLRRDHDADLVIANAENRAITAPTP